jgi:chromosome partitioning protein
VAITIGVTNQKGGVGKTTTAINLAAGLALAGRRSLLVDLDPQGNATSGLGIARDALQSTICELLLGEQSASGCLVETSIDNLQVLPADMRLIAAERQLMEAEHRERRLAQVLESLLGSFDYIVVDAPPSLGLLTLNVLCGVNRVLIPVQSEYYALEGLSLLLETVERVRESVNPELEILGLLMTMVDGRTNLARQVVEEVLRHFDRKVFRTVIARSVRLSEAPSHGQPILTYDPRSASALAYQALVQEVIDRCEIVSSDITEHTAPIDQVVIHDDMGASGGEA